MQSFSWIGLFFIAFFANASHQNGCNDEHSSVCHLENGTSTCCPMKDAICCEKDDYCCPKGKTCHISFSPRDCLIKFSF